MTDRPTADTPREALEKGLCPGCLGHGWTHRFVPVTHEGPCSMCGGVGTLEAMEAHQAFMYELETGRPLVADEDDE